MVAEYAVKTLAAMPGKHRVWAVGERAHARLADAGLPMNPVHSAIFGANVIPHIAPHLRCVAKRSN